MSAFVAISVLILAFGLVSERLHRSPVTPPMVFVLAGIGMGAGLLGLDETVDALELTRLLAEVTLVIVLFTDASRIRVKELAKNFPDALRLLLVSMPLTVVLGTILAKVCFPELTLVEGVILASVLAPTDAALGQAVVSSKAVPARIRQALNVESGLNDGLALPLVVIAIAYASMHSEPGFASVWTWFTAKQLILAPLVGIAVGGFGGRLVRTAAEARWMSTSFQQLSALALALIAFLVSEELGGNGFIAAFLAGLALGHTAGSARDTLQEFAETEGQLLALMTFLCFGAHLLWPFRTELAPIHWAYALASLTVVRMIPVALSLLGTGLRPMSILFMGWFGPRGLASVLFALMVLESELPGSETIFVVSLATVCLSVFAHGLTAWPASQRYAESCSLKPELTEHEMPANAPELAPRIAFRMDR